MEINRQVNHQIRASLCDHDYCAQMTSSEKSENIDLSDLLQLDFDEELLLKEFNWSPDFEAYWDGQLTTCDTGLDFLLTGASGPAVAVDDAEDDGYKSHGSATSPSVGSPSVQGSEVSPSFGSPHGSEVSEASPVPTGLIDHLIFSTGDALQMSFCSMGASSSLPAPEIERQSVHSGQATSVLVSAAFPSSLTTTVEQPQHFQSVPVKPTTRVSMSAKARAEQADKRLSGPTAFMSHAVCWQYGELNLTPEEVSVLKSEGLPIPSTLPLSAEEEKAIKHVRRKIKNKISAQESRRKRKEYIDALEKQLSASSNVNQQLLDRVAELEKRNSSLQDETSTLRKQMATVPQPLSDSPSSSTPSSSTSHFSVLVFAVIFAIMVPFWTTHNVPSLWSSHHLPMAGPSGGVANLPSESLWPDELSRPVESSATVDVRIVDAHPDPKAFSGAGDGVYDYSPVTFHSRTLLHFTEVDSDPCCQWGNGTSRMDEPHMQRVVAMIPSLPIGASPHLHLSNYSSPGVVVFTVQTSVAGVPEGRNQSGWQLSLLT